MYVILFILLFWWMSVWLEGNIATLKQERYMVFEVLGIDPFFVCRRHTGTQIAKELPTRLTGCHN
jgi:hypothetical protein